jgi:hypothetical protein
MFLFEPLATHQVAAFFAVLFGLIILNEISRRSMWSGIACFIVLPLVLSFAVWPTTTTAEGSTVGTWFHWAKVYSCLAGCIGFMALRYVKGAAKNKYMLFFPAFILGLNILEAVIRDFQVSTFGAPSLQDGMMIQGGLWNIFNGVAGILNIVTICGWVGIFVSSRKSKDMLWPDMLWFWIIAYDLWNFAYVYNCVPDHAFYAGAALLLSCTIPAFFIQKGAWLQHRAHTLGFWMMFVMTFPSFVDTSSFAVKSSGSVEALWLMSILSFVANVAVFVYQVKRIRARKLSPIHDELYQDLVAFEDVAKFKNLTGQVASGYTATTRG